MGAMLGLLNQVPAHICKWEIENWQMPELVQQHNVGTIGDGDSSKNNAYASAAVFPAKSQILFE
jgi:hypothetical protein